MLENPILTGYDPLETFPDDFPCSDGVPLETYWHFWQIALLLELTESRWADRYDYFCGGNMFVHYSLERSRRNDFRGPDFFLVRDVDRRRERKYWASWDEDGRLPDLIVELLSDSTAANDRGEKFRICERTFKTQEYFLCDPRLKSLEGFRLNRGRYQPIPRDAQGRIFSEVLECALGFHHWTERDIERRGIRYFEPDGALIPTIAERLAKAEARIAQLEPRS